MKKFWNFIRDETAPDARVLRLEGTIAEESWFDDDVTPALFKDELFSSTGPVTVWINSPGGDCVASAQIYNMLMDYPGDVTVKVDGIAASIASVILCACDRVVIRTGAQVMIHDPMTGCWGNATDFATVIEQLSIAKDCILELYSTKMSEKVDREALANLMTAETWLTSQNITEVFNFEVENAEPMVACASTFYDRYTRLPPGVSTDTDKDAKKDKILADLYLYGTK